MGWETSRDTIGQNRTWIVGRALAGVYFLTIGLTLLAVGLVLAAVFAVADGLYTVLFNRPLNFGRTFSQALFMHQLRLGQYTLGMESYPGLLPKFSSGRR